MPRLEPPSLSDYCRRLSGRGAPVLMACIRPDRAAWAEGEGRLRGIATGNNTDGALNSMPRMEAKTLLDGHRSILDTICSPRTTSG